MVRGAGTVRAFVRALSGRWAAAGEREGVEGRTGGVRPGPAVGSAAGCSGRCRADRAPPGPPRWGREAIWKRLENAAAAAPRPDGFRAGVSWPVPVCVSCEGACSRAVNQGWQPWGCFIWKRVCAGALRINGFPFSNAAITNRYSQLRLCVRPRAAVTGRVVLCPRAAEPACAAQCPALCLQVATASRPAARSPPALS